LRLVAEGADQLDVGGESTRPGAAAVPIDEELRRVVPVIEALSAQGCAVAVDTRHPEVAAAALKAGAGAVNDIEGLRDPRMIELCARHGAGACAMHMRGAPKDMQSAPAYRDVVEEVEQFLSEALARWRAAGLPDAAFAPDPGIGFGKTAAHNHALIAATARFRKRLPGCPWYLGMSRKSFIAGTAGVPEGSDRLAGSLGAAVTAFLSGADILRVHDVAATREALLVAAACRGVP
jgi:dihydropteroate synthase